MKKVVTSFKDNFVLPFIMFPTILILTLNVTKKFYWVDLGGYLMSSSRKCNSNDAKSS